MDFGNNFLSDLSNDELMLEELGRRDGIYSFIFHELDSKSPTSSSEQCLLSEDIDLIKKDLQSVKEDDISKKNLEYFMLHKNKDIAEKEKDLKSFETIVAAPPHLVIPTTRNDIMCNYTAMGSSTSSTYVNSQYSPFYGNGSDRAPLWESTTVPLIYDCNISNVSNQLFRLRSRCPSFSHYTEPLVRNRRHALKDTAEYKISVKQKIQNLEISDLRHLFPNDPDVCASYMEKKVISNGTSINKED